MVGSLVGTGIQLWWSWRWDAARAPKPEPLPSPSGTVTVLACMRNESSRVRAFAERLLPAVLEAERAGMSVEVVAVDDGSTDDTWSLLGEACDNHPGWRRVQVTHTRPGKRDALEAGMQASQGDTILATDADCMPLHPSWIVRMTAGSRTHWDVRVGISLPLQRDPEAASWLFALQTLEAERLAQRAVGAVEAGSPYLAFGRNMAWTKDMWKQTQGMRHAPSSPSGDDDLWLQQACRAGARVQACLDPQGQTASEWPSTWKAWRTQKTRHFSASSHYPWTTLVRLGLPGLGWTLLVASVVHNPSVTSVAGLALSIVARTLTFGTFLHRAGRPALDAWRILLEPLVALFRTWSWWKGATSESIPWK